MAKGIRRRFVAAADPLCPRCGYDMRFSPSRVCSECGLAREAGLWLRRRWEIVIVGLIVSLGLPAYVTAARVHQFGWDAWACAGPICYVLPFRSLQTAADGNYHMAAVVDRHEPIDRSTWYPQFAVLTGPGKFKYTFADDHVILGWDANETGLGPDQVQRLDRTPISLPPFIDLDGDGVPEAIIQHHFQGQQEQTYLKVVTLGAHPREWSPLAGQSSAKDSSDGEQVDHFFRAEDGHLVAVTLDDENFVGFHGAAIGSPMPRAMLRFKSGQFVVSPEDMRAPLPSDAEMDKIIQLGRQTRPFKYLPDGGDDFYNPMMQMMVDCIYSGNSDIAYELLDRAWPGTAAEKAAFKHEFQLRLKKSVFWPALVELGHPPIG